MAATTSDLRADRLPRRAIVAGWLYATFAVAVFALRWFGEQAGVREAHPARVYLAAVALAALYLLPAALVFLARWHRPALLLAAGVVGVVLVPTTFSISPLLLIPAFLLFRVAPTTRGGLLVAFCLAALAFGSFAAWIQSSDEVCWREPTGGVCSELPTTSSSLLSLGITLAALGGATTATEPVLRR
jgi:hypothetical protein